MHNVRYNLLLELRSDGATSLCSEFTLEQDTTNIIMTI